MGITLEMQLEFFIWSVIVGLLSGLIYDVFRTIRTMRKPKNASVMVHDILFIVLVAIAVFALSVTVGRGELRFFEFAGILCGFVLYRLAFKDSIVKMLCAFVRFLIKCVVVLIKILMFPLVVVWKMLKKPINIIVWYVQRKAQRGGSAIKIRRERYMRSVKNFILCTRKK